MWSLIHKDHFPNFINKYPSIEEFADEIKLLTNNDYIFLPKFTNVYYPYHQIINYKDEQFIPKQIKDLEFTVNLRNEQIDMVDPFVRMKTMANKMHGCLKARPGAGKTVMGVYLACMMKSVTLIMINNTNLADQWKKTILNFTNCTEDDIGLIQGSKFDVENKKFIISTVQTFCSKIKTNVAEFYMKIKPIGINFVLFDECHHSISGPKYALSSLVLNTDNIVGLSATPFVSGLQEFLMTNTVGRVISNTKQYNLKPIIRIIKFNSGLNKKACAGMRMMTDLLKIRAKYNSVILQSEKYFKLILKINQYLTTVGHRLINVFFTKKQVNEISDYLTSNNIPNIKYFGEQRELDKTKDKNLVVTYQFAGEGFDYEQLSACVIAIPLSGRKSLIQVIGRILRTSPDKLQPEVFILVDTVLGNTFTRDIPRIVKILSEEFGIEPEIIDM